LFDRVVLSYAEIKSYPRLAAACIDPDPTVLQQVWRPHLSHFCCDVERITELAIGGNHDLEAAWFKLAQGESVPRAVEVQVVSKCGRLYSARGLDPRHYFGIASRFGLEEEA